MAKDYFAEEIESSKAATKDYFAEEVEAPKDRVGGVFGFGSVARKDYEQGERNFLGNVFERPGAAVRSAIQGKGYAAGAANPAIAPTFQELSARKASEIAGHLPRPLAGPVGGMLSVMMQGGGQTADILTNPADVLTSMPIGRVTKLALPYANQAVKNMQRLPKDVSQAASQEFDKVAEQISNSLISPSKKQMIFGEPGKAIGKEGLVANSMDELYEKVVGKTDELVQQLDQNYSANPNVIRNYTSSMRPLLSALNELNRNPKTNSAAITRLQNLIDDLSGASTGNIRKFYLNPAEARKLKQNISDFADWTLEGKSDKLINKAVKEAYSKVDNILDEAMPNTKLLNKRVTDLISAQKAIESRMAILAKRELLPSSMWDIFNVPFNILKSVPVKTRMASVLAKKYTPSGIDVVEESKMFNPLFRTSITSQTKGLPHPKDVPYNPTGQRVPYNTIRMGSAEGEGVIQLPDKTIAELNAASRRITHNEIKASLEKFKNSDYAKDVKLKALKARIAQMPPELQPLAVKATQFDSADDFVKNVLGKKSSESTQWFKGFWDDVVGKLKDNSGKIYSGGELYHGTSKENAVVSSALVGIAAIGNAKNSEGSQSIDIKKINQIESSGKADAIGDNGKAFGINQIYEGTLNDFNKANKKNYTTKDLMNEAKNNEVADWYFNIEIPRLLKYNKFEDTIENRIKAYNWGIGNMKKGGAVPKITLDYIKKYKSK